MKNYLSIAVSSIGISFAVGCATKRLVLQAEVVSMTHTDSGSVKNLKIEPQSVEEEWCVGDEPVLPSKDKTYGLADQVIYKAQNKGSRADFITGATVYVTGSCASVSGKRARM